MLVHILLRLHGHLGARLHHGTGVGRIGHGGHDLR
jgi:hypothetical protein